MMTVTNIATAVVVIIMPQPSMPAYLPLPSYLWPFLK